jgi:transposase-like protein
MSRPAPPPNDSRPPSAVAERLRQGADARTVAREFDLPLALVAEWAADLRAAGHRQ